MPWPYGSRATAASAVPSGVSAEMVCGSSGSTVGAGPAGAGRGGGATGPA